MDIKDFGNHGWGGRNQTPHGRSIKRQHKRWLSKAGLMPLGVALSLAIGIANLVLYIGSWHASANLRRAAEIVDGWPNPDARSHQQAR